jgi:hypothetical protein
MGNQLNPVNMNELGAGRGLAQLQINFANHNGNWPSSQPFDDSVYNRQCRVKYRKTFFAE